MIGKKIPSWAVPLLILIVIIVVALWLRVVLPYDQVFVGDWVKMTGVDAYYYMRLVDNLVKNFPQLTQFDPYLRYPGIVLTGAYPHFFAYFTGGIIWLISLGQADQRMVDVIAVYIPPVLAVLTILAVFIIGRALGGKWLGLLAAGLLAIIPGEFLNRSLLGFTDHHIAEVMFSTGMMMFVFLAIKEGEGKRLGQMVKGDWKSIGRPAMYGLLGGVFLWLYMLTWAGALLFSLILFIFIVVQAVLDHLKGRPPGYLGILGVCLFGTGLALYLPWRGGDILTITSLVIGILVSILLPLISFFVNKGRMSPWAYPLLVMGIGMLAAAALAIVSPAMLQSIVGSLATVFLWHTGTTVSELQPLLIQQGNFTFMVAVSNFMLAFFFSLIAIGVLIYQVIKSGQPDKTLLLVWSVIILLSALAMRRSAYYYAVNVALLTGYLCWIPLGLLLPNKETAGVTVAKETTAKSRRRAEQHQARAGIKRNTIFVALLLVIIALLVYYPITGPLPDGQRPAIDLATRPSRAPSDAWCESMDWLRTNTEEPFGNPESYYELYKPVNEKGGFEYPPGAYGILAWWDCGYWIARMGHRAPAANPGDAPIAYPGTGLLSIAAYFTSQDEPSAARMMDARGTRYVIVDNQIAAGGGKFHALVTLGGASDAEFSDVFFQRQGNQYVSMTLFYPKYYRSMVARLYNFDGKSVVPDVVNVLAYEENKAQDGTRYKEITEFKTFSSYNEAQKFILDNKDRGYIIVGQDPNRSPVPLEELREFTLVYGSTQKVSAGSKPQSEIKIFEYKGPVTP